MGVVRADAPASYIVLTAIRHSFHITLFASFFLLDVSVLFLIANIDNSSDATQPAPGSASQRRGIGALVLGRRSEGITIGTDVNRALWTASTCLSISLFSITIISMLNKRLDKPGTLKVDSRLLRMAPRIVMAIVTVFLPLVPGLACWGWLLIEWAMMYAVVMWEFLAGLQTGAKLFEPAHAINGS